MNTDLISDIISGSASPVEALNRLVPLTASDKERRGCVLQAAQQLAAECAARDAELAHRKKELHESRYKFENLSELASSISQLQETLNEHRQQVRVSEGASLAVSVGILEYDTAKTRSNKLMQIIRAKMQYERAREALREVEQDDPSKTLSYIVDLQSSQETLQKYLPTPAVNNELEELKDGFLAWQSTALVIAIQQADYTRLLDIQKIYQSLNRQAEFVGIFRRVSSSRLKEVDLSGIDKIDVLFNTLYKEIEYILDHHLSIIRRFHDETETAELIKEAVSEGLESLDISSMLAVMIGQSDDPISLTSNIRKIFNDCRERILQSPTYSKFMDVVSILKTKSIAGMTEPFKASFSNVVLAKINTLELRGASHRVHVENLNTCVTETLQMLSEIASHSCQLFGTENALSIYGQAIDCGLENLVSKLKSWQYWLGSGERSRGVDDLVLVASASGHLLAVLDDFKSRVDVNEDSYKRRLREVTSFCRTACLKVLAVAAESVIVRMTPAMANIHTELGKVDDTHTKSLPLFSFSPHEYITNAGQDLLHLFHRFEQFFIDDNLVHAFHVANKKKFEGEEIYKNVMEQISMLVIEALCRGVTADTEKLAAPVAKQFLVDAVFLKDALDDLRCDNLEKLKDLEARLRKHVEK